MTRSKDNNNPFFGRFVNRPYDVTNDIIIQKA